MNDRSITDISEYPGELCDTLFYQGNGCSQTHALNYIGNQKVLATTGELMWSTGRKNYSPLNVVYKLHIGTEIADVNLHPFDSYFSYLNPIKVIGAAASWAVNWVAGYHISSPAYPTVESVKYHAPNLSQVSIGQQTDMLSHRRKYDSWLAKKDKSGGLILYGVSRGTAATFCAFAKEKYPEVRLVILEGAIDSVENVIPKRVSNVFKSEYISGYVTSAINRGLSFFKRMNIIQYDAAGPSPLKSVAEFPENVPVVFITSEMDKVVTCSNTENIAIALASKGKNDVYLLKLKRSSHPGYMYDDNEDRTNYETFLHAIYKKYHLKHAPKLVNQGENLMRECTLHELKHNYPHP
jgi:hypothetical protein